jgi:hypothetical protein
MNSNSSCFGHLLSPHARRVIARISGNLLSGFAVNSEGTRQTSIDKVRRSYKASGQRRDEQVAAVEYEKKERAEHGGE